MTDVSIDGFLKSNPPKADLKSRYQQEFARHCTPIIEEDEDEVIIEPDDIEEDVQLRRRNVPPADYDSDLKDEYDRLKEKYDHLRHRLLMSTSLTEEDSQYLEQEIVTSPTEEIGALKIENEQNSVTEDYQTEQISETHSITSDNESPFESNFNGNSSSIVS